jgi:uncharacterized alkaline shock family protein YloU
MENRFDNENMDQTATPEQNSSRTTIDSGNPSEAVEKPPADANRDLKDTVLEKANQARDTVLDQAGKARDFVAEKFAEANMPVDEKEYQDSYKFSENVIEKISGIAAREIKGVLDLKGSFVNDIIGGLVSESSATPRRGVKAQVGEQNVIVELKMIIEYGAPAPAIFKQLRENVAKQLFVMTGLNLAQLNVEVVDVMTRKEYEQTAARRFSQHAKEQQPYEKSYDQLDETDLDDRAD